MTESDWSVFCWAGEPLVLAHPVLAVADPLLDLTRS